MSDPIPAPNLSPDPAVRLLRERRTVSQASLDPRGSFDPGIPLAAVESARWAPNHRLTEPWRFYLLDRERIARLGDLWAETLERRGSHPDKVAAKRSEWSGAPGVLVLVCESAEGSSEIERREDYAACCCAGQNFMLHLWAHGLGSKWSTAAVDEHEGFWPLLGQGEEPAGAVVVGLFFFGVPARVPAGRRARDLSEVLTDFREA